MLDFLRGGADCLVTTTIIESGLDIPSANTLIVERSDQLGLSQAYQIRGRVGRSRERAFAYLLYPSAETLTEEAAARLSTLADHTELGSGFKIAMRDLDIRGAGDLLGEEQSGHVAAVGFELYCQMIDEAVAEAAVCGRRRGGGGARAGPPRRPGRRLPARPPTSPSRRPRSTSTGASSPPASPVSCGRSATSSSDRFGPPPPRSRTCWRCSRRGSSSASPGRAASSCAAGGSASPGSSSIPSRPASSPSRSRGRCTSGARKPPRVRVPEEPEGRLAAVLTMAKGLRAAKGTPNAEADMLPAS